MAIASTATGTAERMTEACHAFLDSLSPEQRERTTYDYLDGERLFWYYPPLNRHGLSLRDMDAKQRRLAYAVMGSGLTEQAYRKATLIIDHELILGPLEKEEDKINFERDPELYFFTVFGEPDGADHPWGWRVEGHHISLHYSVWGDRVISATPLFFGANPAEVRKGPKKGLRILGDREELAFELMSGLDSGQRSKAIIYETAPLDILTYNSSKVSLPTEEGLPATRMSKGQKAMLMALVTEYVRQVPDEISSQRLAELEEGGLDRLHLAWGGSVERGEQHYYRIHGGDFVVEYDNQQDEANHIHSVWRDVKNDFGSDVLREHLLWYHLF